MRCVVVASSMLVGFWAVGASAAPTAPPCPPPAAIQKASDVGRACSPIHLWLSNNITPSAYGLVLGLGNVTGATRSSRMDGLVVGPLYNRAGNLHGVQVGQGVNHVQQELNGVQAHIGAGLFATVVAQQILGAQPLVHRDFATFAWLLSGLNHAEVVHGVQIGGWHNSADRLRGVQIGLSNFVNDNEDICDSGSLAGFQLGIAFNRVRRISGVQVGLVNWAAVGGTSDDAGIKGLQLAGMHNRATRVRGVQMAAFVNFADSVVGVQIGLVNRARRLCGVQLGALNVGNGVIIPLVNIGWQGCP